MSGTAEGTQQLLARRAAAQEREAKAQAKQHERGRTTARERIDRFLDAGSFNEIDAYRREPLGPAGGPRPEGDAVIIADRRPVEAEWSTPPILLPVKFGTTSIASSSK